MHANLAGHLPLADMIDQVISESRTKVASIQTDDKDKKRSEDKKAPPFQKKDAKKEEREDSGEHETENMGKSASALDFSDPDDIEKLAAALENVGDQLEKDAGQGRETIEMGGEPHGGGTVLPVVPRIPGKQPWTKSHSKHEVPMRTEEQTGDAGGAKSQVKNDHDHTPGAGKAYPAKGVFKTASEGVMAKIRAAAGVEKDAAFGSPFVAGAKGAGSSFKKKTEENDKHFKKNYDEKSDSWRDEKKDKKDDEKKEKDSSAQNSPVDFILGKLANTEKQMGGMTLDSKSGEGVKLPAGADRKLISSNQSVVNATKREAKAPQKKLLTQVLTEPAMSKTRDPVIEQNLRNASKGGVKIAAARVLLQKIAEEGCTCDGKGECKYCKMKKAMKKESMGDTSMSALPKPSTSMSASGL